MCKFCIFYIDIDVQICPAVGDRGYSLPSPKAKTALFRGLFFSSIFPFLSCYNFIRCKGVRCVSQNFDRWCGARSFLLTRDFTVGKSSFFRRFDEPCFAARNRLTAENDRTLIARHRLFSVIFSLFVLAGVSPPASQKEKISRKFLCGGCEQFLRSGFLS